MQNETSVVIDRPIDEVFRLTNEHVAEWSIVVVEDEVIDEKPNGVGTTFRTVTEEKGKRMEFQGVVTRFDPPHTSAIHLTNKMLDINTEFRFERFQGGTRVTQNADVAGKGFFRIMMFLGGWLMNKASCKASENELHSLKRFCENYDGAVNNS